MKRKGLSQEGLKLIACVTMLLDHVGAIIIDALFQKAAATGANAGQLLDLYEILRIVGRLAFPIYCFLLAEGAHYTKNAKRYALRLLGAAVLAEIPFDLAFFGGLTWQHQNVMVTLLLGFCAIKALEVCPNGLMKLLCAVVFGVLADWMACDYRAEGIWMILLFALTRERPHRKILQFFGLWLIFSPSHVIFLNWLGGIRITVQEWAILALIPIFLYDGRKLTHSKAAQWGFYLFYPVHLLILALLEALLYG